MNLRGRVVTVVHLAALLGLEGERLEGPAGRVVLLDRGRRDLGLLVTDVDGILELEEVAHAPGQAQPAVRGVAQTPAGSVTVLDADDLERRLVALFRER